jgi:hypothetical protein
MPFIDYKDENGVVSKLEWTPLKEVAFVPLKGVKIPPPMTFGEEVQSLVREWYNDRNMPIPPEDIQACREMDIIQSAENKKIAESAASVVPKPVYGTPEFWKDWWAKKKAKEASGDEPKKAVTKKTQRQVPKLSTPKGGT